MKTFYTWRVGLLTLALLLLSLSSCDSGGSDVSRFTPPERQSVAVYRSIPDTSMFPSTYDLELDFRDYFQQSEGLSLDFEFEVIGTSIKAPRVLHNAHVFQILAKQQGESSLVVIATDRHGHRATDTLTVSVLNPCPSGPDENESDYFPIHEGKRWVFERTRVESGNGNVIRDAGESTWDVLSEGACRRGEQTYVLQESFTGTRTRKIWNGVSFDSTSTELLWSDTFRLFISDSVKVRHLHPATLPRILPRTAPQTLEVNSSEPGSSWWWNEIRLQKGVGPVFQTRGSGSKTGSHETNLTLLETS